MYGSRALITSCDVDYPGGKGSGATAPDVETARLRVEETLARTPATEYFGAELRRARQAAGLSREDFGRLVSYAPGTVGAFETGERFPQPSLVEGADAHLGTDGLLGRMEARVAARMQRQEILRRDHPPEFVVLIDEGVLRRPVGGREVMRHQLLGLAEAAERWIIQVVPWEVDNSSASMARSCWPRWTAAIWSTPPPTSTATFSVAPRRWHRYGRGGTRSGRRRCRAVGRGS
jgi:transcriptional regulator with XRE-family HTH domain